MNSSPCRMTHIGGLSTFSPGGCQMLGTVFGGGGPKSCESSEAYLEQLAEAGRSVTARICETSCQLGIKAQIQLSICRRTLSIEPNGVRFHEYRLRQWGLAAYAGSHHSRVGGASGANSNWKSGPRNGFEQGPSSAEYSTL